MVSPGPESDSSVRGEGIYAVSGRSRTTIAILAATLAGGVTSACLIGAWWALFRPPNLGLPKLIVAGLLLALA